MAQLPLAYPLSVGRVSAGRWSSSVPDRLDFEGRVGVPVGADPADDPRAPGGGRPRRLPGGDHRLDRRRVPSRDDRRRASVRPAGARGHRRRARPPGAGGRRALRRRHAAVLRRGIPCVMVGTGGLELAHALDESVAAADVEALARSPRPRDRPLRRYVNISPVVFFAGTSRSPSPSPARRG